MELTEVTLEDYLQSISYVSLIEPTTEGGNYNCQIGGCFSTHPDKLAAIAIAILAAMDDELLLTELTINDEVVQIRDLFHPQSTKEASTDDE